MQIGNRIREIRQENNLSQEDLALKIFVSRQSISNWENDKTYPDLKSLLLMSRLFNVSLDSLVKGDLEIMKKHINENEIREFNKESNIFGVLLAAVVITPIPLKYLLNTVGVGIWGIIVVITLVYSFKVEKLKRKHNIYTYKEISAFLESKPLEKDDILIEKGKRKFQPYFYMLISASIAIIIAVIMDFIVSSVF